MTKHKKKTPSKKKATKNPSPKRPLKLPAFINSNLIFYTLIAVFCTIIFIIRLNFLDMPFERDEGDYALAGKLLLEGGRPYVDFFEQKPPGLFYSYAMIEAFFGKTIQGLHLGFIFVNIGSLLLLSFALKKFISPIAAATAGIVYGILTLNPFASGFTVQAEHLLNLFVCGSIYFLTLAYKKEKLWPLIVSGALVAWSATIKQNGLFFIIAIVLGVALFAKTKKDFTLKKIFIKYVYLGIGGIGMVLFVFLLMLLNGVWSEFIFWAIEFPRETYVSEIPFSQGMTYLKSYYERISSQNLWIWYGAMVGIVLLLFSKINWGIKAWVILIGALAFFSIWPGYRFYGHYWLQFFIGISILFAVGLQGFTDLLARFTFKRLGMFVPLLAVATFLTLDLIKHQDYYFKPNNREIVKRIYGSNPFVETYDIAEYLVNRGATKDDKLLVLGSEPQLHFQTGMQSPTPHTFIAFTAGQHPRAVEWRKEYLEMLQDNEAKYAVVVVHPFSWLASTPESQAFFSSTFRHVNSNYNRIGIIDMVGGQSIYKWEQEAVNYQPKSKNFVSIYERR